MQMRTTTPCEWWGTSPPGPPMRPPQQSGHRKPPISLGHRYKKPSGTPPNRFLVLVALVTLCDLFFEFQGKATDTRNFFQTSRMRLPGGFLIGGPRDRWPAESVGRTCWTRLPQNVRGKGLSWAPLRPGQACCARNPAVRYHDLPEEVFRVIVPWPVWGESCKPLRDTPANHQKLFQGP